MRKTPLHVFTDVTVQKLLSSKHGCSDMELRICLGYHLQKRLFCDIQKKRF